ncbi:MAG: TetR/AcrR family transcriptional regulator [Bacillota bacterium]|nr:TetR/AcrR family transcriptional regulator [Bacillota bacterium]
MISNESQKSIRNAKTRNPRQLRSINTKEKILDSAFSLFCEKGYYKTTTNEIAQRAQVSIGSLYSYFEDKDTIFFEILDRYHKKFEIAKNEIVNDQDFFKTNSRLWLRALIENLIKVHEESKELNRELNVLSYYNPKIAEILEKNKEKTMQNTIGYFFEMKEGLITEDIQAAATVTFDLISATIDRIVFGRNEIDRSRLIEATIDIILKSCIA